jgi:sRNA-binding carbon storage regulator CsrA
VKVEKRRAKLLGVDAPEHVEVTVVEISQEDVALADLVREAAAAVAEQQLRERTKPC